MAENHRNDRSENRFSNQEWDNDYNRQQTNWEDRYQQSNQGQDRDSGYSGMGSRYNRQNEERGWDRTSRQSDWGRGGNEYNRGGYSSGNYGNEDRNFGYGGREYGSNYGGGQYQGNSSYYDSGQYGNSGRQSYGSTRNLYDRDYDRFDRGSGNRGSSGLGGANYGGRHEQDGRRSYDHNPYFGSSNPRNYQGESGQYGNYGRDRDYGRGDSNERSWWDRTRDEVSSWFGDEDAERRRERDMREGHRGKGPRNYSRSDDRIKEDINDRLSDDPWVDASDIDVTVSGGDVTLTGTVYDRGDKRRAEDLAEAVSGVKNVENRLRVGRRDASGSGMGSGSSGSLGTTEGGSYASSETSASRTGTTGTTTQNSGDKNKSKSNYVTG